MQHTTASREHGLSERFKQRDAVIRLLLIDTDLTLEHLALAAGRSAGVPLQTHWTHDFDEALDELRHGDYDLCLLSDELGARSGLDLLQAATSARTAPPIIMITSNTDPGLAKRALDAGAAHLHERNASGERTLGCAIRFALEQHRLRRELLEYAVNLERANAELEREAAVRERIDAELARSNQELEQFAYATSHDLQAPLRVVSSYLRLLEQRLGDALDQDCREFLDFAVDGSQRMSHLIAELLDYSRITTRPGELEPTDCLTVVGDALANLHSAIEESGATVICDDLPTIHVDAAQICRLFQNLLANAIKFHNGNVPRIEISADRDADSWIFSVSDNGIGIDPKFHDRIFGIFQRLHTREQFEGTGIGLALCRRIVERHGGTIWVESRPGAGSTFRFTIPTPPTNTRDHADTGPPRRLPVPHKTESPRDGRPES